MVQFEKEKQREGTETKSAQATNIPHTMDTKYLQENILPFFWQAESMDSC